MAKGTENPNAASRSPKAMCRLSPGQAFLTVRFEKWPYMLLFPLMPIILQLRNALMAEAPPILGVSAYFAMGIAFSLGIGLMFWPAKKDTAARNAHITAYATALLFALWMVLPVGAAASAAGLLFSLFLGGCAAYALYGFTYALHDGERFLGALLTAFSSAISQTVLSLPDISEHGGQIFLGIQVVGTVLCLTRYRLRDIEEKRPQSGDTRMLMGVVLFFFFAQRAVMFFHSYLMHAESNVYVGIAGIMVCGFAALVYAKMRFHVWHLCNLFFAGMLCVYGLRLLAPQHILASDILQGTGLAGFIASYYLIGHAFQCTVSFHGFKKLLAAVFGAALLLHIGPGLMAAHYPHYIVPVGAGTVIVLFLVFVLTTPFFARSMFVKARPSPEELRTERMEQYGFTLREREIALLLLKGRMIKECAAELNISQETVKYHAKNIYRKLGISGRTELSAVLEQKTEEG